MNHKFKTCAAQSCERNAHRCENGKLGYCSMHYQRFRKYGDPEMCLGVPSPAIDWIEKHKNHKGTECLTWPFHFGKDGYGRINNPSRNGRSTTASRYMLLQSQGLPPTNKHDCAHSCGYKGCVNPCHLRWATRKENEADKLEHGTRARGERNGHGRLTRKDVLKIRTMPNSHTHAQIAKMFGISRNHVTNIINRKRWAWLNP